MVAHALQAPGRVLDGTGERTQRVDVRAPQGPRHESRSDRAGRGDPGNSRDLHDRRPRDGYGPVGAVRRTTPRAAAVASSAGKNDSIATSSSVTSRGEPKTVIV